MGKRVRDKTKPKKIKTPPKPNQGLVNYSLYLMPQPNEIGSFPKWLSPIEIKGKNRRAVAKQVREDYPHRNWKLRLQG